MGTESSRSRGLSQLLVGMLVHGRGARLSARGLAVQISHGCGSQRGAGCTAVCRKAGQEPGWATAPVTHGTCSPAIPTLPDPTASFHSQRKGTRAPLSSLLSRQVPSHARFPLPAHPSFPPCTYRNGICQVESPTSIHSTSVEEATLQKALRMRYSTKLICPTQGRQPSGHRSQPHRAPSLSKHSPEKVSWK